MDPINLLLITAALLLVAKVYNDQKIFKVLRAQIALLDEGKQTISSGCGSLTDEEFFGYLNQEEKA